MKLLIASTPAPCHLTDWFLHDGPWHSGEATSTTARTTARAGCHDGPRQMTAPLAQLASLLTNWRRPDEKAVDLGGLPAMTARCRTVAEIQTSVKLAAQAGRRVRMAGDVDANAEDVVLDFAAMCDARMIEPGVLRVDGGANVRRALAAANAIDRTLVVTSDLDANFADVLLRGDYGPLVGRMGLASDHLLRAEIVLANGELVQATAWDAADLLWLLRGGGQRVGAVVSVDVEVHALDPVQFAIGTWPVQHLGEVLQWVSGICSVGTEDVTMEVGSVTSADGADAVYCAATIASGADDGSVAAIMRRTQHGAPLGERTANAACELLHHHVSFFTGPVLGAVRLASLGGAVQHAIVEMLQKRPTGKCGFRLHELFGQASRVPSWSTAFRHRTPHLLLVLRGSGNPRSLADETLWAENALTSLAPYAQPDVADETHDRRRMEALRRYDPDGVFGSHLRARSGLAKIADLAA